MRPAYTPSSDALSYAGRAVHDLGMACLLGGQLFGRLALHPAVTAIGDPAERGAVVNLAWRRYGAVNGLGLAVVCANWLAARMPFGEVAARNLVPRERRLARAKDAFVLLTFAVGVATAIEGTRFARSAPGGAVPLEDGDHTAPGAPGDAARRKRRLNALGVAALAAEAGLVVTNAALAQAGFRAAPLRRRILRGS
ncbi:MAG: hypothetical protein M3P39_01790 [Actinomycetota bacterium]|nr:hypothetical protein [Actinomycetota bacterium]